MKRNFVLLVLLIFGFTLKTNAQSFTNLYFQNFDELQPYLLKKKGKVKRVESFIKYPGESEKQLAITEYNKDGWITYKKVLVPYVLKRIHSSFITSKTLQDNCVKEAWYTYSKTGNTKVVRIKSIQENPSDWSVDTLIELQYWKGNLMNSILLNAEQDTIRFRRGEYFNDGKIKWVISSVKKTILQQL